MKKTLILLLLIGLAGCEQAPSSHGRPKSSSSVSVVTVKHSPLGDTRLLTGSLQAVTTVRIFNQEEGRIIRLPYYESDRVEKNAIIAQIDDSLIQAELNKASANLKQARVDARRIQSLSKKNLASEDELARSQTAVELARAEVSLLQTRLAHTRIRAPFAGVISERHYEVGDVVPLHSHILSLIDPAKLKIVIHLSELLLANIKPNTPVQVRIDALGDQHYPASISRIYPSINPRTRQGTIEVRPDSLPAGARPGQLCRITIRSQTTPRKNIPVAAIRHDSKGEYVFRVNADNVIEQTRVQTGIQLGNDIEVISGLKPGDRVVVKGFIGLKQGTKVTILPAANNRKNKQSTDKDA